MWSLPLCFMTMEDYNGAPVLSEAKEKKGSIALAIISGIIAGAIGAAIWAALTVWTERQYAIVAIGIGALIGIAVRILAKGNAPVYGVIAAIITLASCIFGDFFSSLAFIAKSEGISFGEALSSVNWSYFFEIAFLGFDFFTVLFYGIAIYEAYIIAINKDVEEV